MATNQDLAKYAVGRLIVSIYMAMYVWTALHVKGDRQRIPTTGQGCLITTLQLQRCSRE